MHCVLSFFSADLTDFSRVYHNPAEGYYDSDNNLGEDNTNDVFYWAFDTNTENGTDTSVGQGGVWLSVSLHV